MIKKNHTLKQINTEETIIILHSIKELHLKYLYIYICIYFLMKNKKGNTDFKINHIICHATAETIKL